MTWIERDGKGKEGDCVTSWPTHPAADLFPLLDGPDLVELTEDVRVNGLHEPVKNQCLEAVSV